MNLLAKLTDFVGGSLFKEAKSLINEYWPPDVSPEKRAEFEMRMQELEARKQHEASQIALEQLKTELADIQNARQAHSNSRMPAIITTVMTLLATAYGAALFGVIFPEANRDMINNYGGQLITLWVGSVAYWIGTTRSSALKNDIIARSDPIKENI